MSINKREHELIPSFIILYFVIEIEACLCCFVKLIMVPPPVSPQAGNSNLPKDEPRPWPE